jgi:peptidyl-prolyl cis-trans isomerase D
VVEVVEVIPARPQALASVSADIEKRLQDDKAQDLLADAIAKAEDRLNAGESLADVAKDLGLTLQTAPPLTADGRSFDSNFEVQELKLPVLPRVFEADQADGGQLAEIEGGRYALFEISDVVPPLLVPLDRIRDGVVMAWQIRTRSDAAKVEAERIASEASSGKTLAAAIGNRRLPPPQELAVRRLELTQMAQQGQQVPPPVVMLLNTPRGQARVIPAPGGQGWFVVKVDAVEPGNLAEAPQLVDAVRQSFAREAGIELVETYVRAIERDVGVVQKPDATRAVNRRLTGAQVE